VLKPWLKKGWCIPPKANAQFVFPMEDVLDIYTRPYDPKRPQVCLDEASKQLLAAIRPPLPATPGRLARSAAESARHGTAALFMICAPLAGQRHVRVRERRTAVDWAHVLKEVVDDLYPDAERIVLVMDQRNTHTPASLYDAFPPAEAKRLADQLDIHYTPKHGSWLDMAVDIHYTPKHGSWLDMAELELSVLARQCLDDRFPDRDALTAAVTAWAAARHASRAPIAWRFTTADARITLKHLYPSLDS
jgi:hypothetical protein